MIGARSPASCATSMKRALKGRREGADLGIGLALCVEMPCVRSKVLPSETPAPNPNRANLRRVIFTDRCPRGNTCAYWTDPYRFASVTNYKASGTNPMLNTKCLSSRRPVPKKHKRFKKSPSLHLEHYLPLNLRATLRDAHVNLVRPWSEFVCGQICNVGNSSVPLRLGQRRLGRSEVVPFLVERHRQPGSVLNGVIGVHREVERQNISRPALERVSEGGHDLAARKIEGIQDLIVFQRISSTHHDYVTHRQIVGGFRDRDSALLHTDLLVVSVHQGGFQRIRPRS